MFTSQSKTYNYIMKIKDEGLGWVTQNEDIDNLIVTHFRNMFKSNGPRNMSRLTEWVKNRVNSQMNTSICDIVSNEYVMFIVFELGALKGSGLDNVLRLVFKKYWNVVGDEICIFVKAFFNY